ncbi:MAG TPA: o-succinylbenzoate synthase [Anaerolineaceae bacterium]|nr:o-succinylbenzoate synthase [Anaerolineaceae bacterium]
MKIDFAELRIIRLRLLHHFETSFGVEEERTIPLLTLYSQSLEGYSEGVMEVLPLYREEFVAGAVSLLKDAFLPKIIGADIQTPQDILDKLAVFRGNRMAKAMIEMAFWDIWSKSQNQPLYRMLGGNRQNIPVGVSLGIQKSLQATREQVQKHLEQGYQRIKLKIKPGWDIQMISYIRQEFPDAVLTVDANSSYSLADINLLHQLDQYQLDYIEQPLAYDDIIDHASLQRQLTTSICLDESILSREDARKALEIGAGRVINIKVGRVGGHQEAQRVHDVAKSFNVPVWCGGMLESGIGRAHNIHLATLPNFSKPGDTSSSSRYWAQDIINEPLETKDGFMPVPQGLGIGVTLNRPYLKKLTVFEETFRS